jgi:peptide/nickel transport system substrate-binding protein
MSIRGPQAVSPSTRTLAEAGRLAPDRRRGIIASTERMAATPRRQRRAPLAANHLRAGDADARPRGAVVANGPNANGGTLVEKKRTRLLALAMMLALAGSMVACNQAAKPGSSEGAEGAATVPSTEVVTQTIASESKVPVDTFVGATIGEPESLDPAWSYETTGSAYESNLYDGLVYFDREKPDEFVPALATEWTVSEDGLTYEFKIRPGVKFHAGGDLQPHDIGYSIQRALLQDRADGPMWLFLEPLLGTSSIEQLALETSGLDQKEDATLDDVPAEVKTEVCELVKAAVSADDEAGTVTIKVKQPTPWFLQLLSQPWGAALDQEWMTEQGDWDGSCATWSEFHNPEAQESILFDRANGTGPYSLGQWKKGEEITFEANENYWRTEPIWEGGPSGPPRIKHIVVKKVEEWSTRLAMLQAGEADTVVVDRAQIAQVDPLVQTVYEGRDESAPSEVKNADGTLKLFKGYPTASSTAAMFAFAINPDSEFIGSGALDGEGIPVDFFTDLDVRQGFNYCFDWETYIADGLQGEGFQVRGPIIEGLQGWRADSDVYAYDLEKCKESLSKAWGGQLPDKGFKMTLVYNQGNDTRKMAAQILAENLAVVNPKYQVTVQELEWPSFLAARREEKLPISISGWLEDYHDASNWVHPFMHSQGAYARAQHFPADMQTKFDTLIDSAVIETDETKRDESYAQLQQMAYDNAIDIFLEQATGRAYFARQVVGWFSNPLSPGTWYYALGKEQ